MADEGTASVKITGDVRDFARQTERDLNESLKKVKPDPVEVPVEVDPEQAEKSGEKAGEKLAEGVTRGADGRLRDARGKFVKAGTAAGEAIGEGITGGTEERVRRNEDKFEDAGRKAGKKAGDGARRGFLEGFDVSGTGGAIKSFIDLARNGLDRMTRVLRSGTSVISSVVGTVLSTAFKAAIGVASVGLKVALGAVLVPALGGAVAAAVTSGLGIGLAAGFIGLGALALKEVKPLQDAVKSLGDTIKDVGREAARPLIKPFLRGLEGLKELAQELKGDLSGIFKDLAPSIKPLVDGLGLFLGEVLRGISDSMPGITAAFDAFSNTLPTIGKYLGDFFRTIFENEDLIDNTTEGLLKLVFGPLKLLGPLISGLNVVFGVFNNALILLDKTNGISNLWKQIMDFVDGGTGALDRIAKAWEPLRMAIMNVWDAMKEFAAEDDTSKLEAKWQALVQALKDAWGPLKEFVSRVWKEIVDGIKLIWEEQFVPWWNETAKPWLIAALKSAFGEAWDAAVQVSRNKLGELIVATWNGLYNLVGQATNALLALPGVVGRAFEQSAIRAGLGIARMVNNVLSRLRGLVGSARNVVGQVQSAIIGVFAGAGGWLVSAGVNLVNGFIQSIRNGFARVRSVLGELTAMLPNWKGPAAVDKKILQESGRLVMQGFETGLTSQFKSVQRTLGGLTSQLPDATGGQVGYGAIKSSASTSSITIAPGAIVINGSGGASDGTAAAEAFLQRLAQANLVR